MRCVLIASQIVTQNVTQMEKQLSFRVPAEIYKRLTQATKGRRGVRKSDLCRKALIRFLDGDEVKKN